MSMLEKRIRYENRLMKFLNGCSKLDGTATINHNQISDLTNYEILPFLFDRILPAMEDKQHPSFDSGSNGVRFFKNSGFVDFSIFSVENKCTYGIEFKSVKMLEVFVKRLNLLLALASSVRSTLSLVYERDKEIDTVLVVYFYYSEYKTNPNQQRIDVLNELKDNLIKSIALIDKELKELQ